MLSSSSLGSSITAILIYDSKIRPSCWSSNAELLIYGKVPLSLGSSNAEFLIPMEKVPSLFSSAADPGAPGRGGASGSPCGCPDLIWLCHRLPRVRPGALRWDWNAVQSNPLQDSLDLEGLRNSALGGSGGCWTLGKCGGLQGNGRFGENMVDMEESKEDLGENHGGFGKMGLIWGERDLGKKRWIWESHAGFGKIRWILRKMWWIVEKEQVD